MFSSASLRGLADAICRVKVSVSSGIVSVSAASDGFDSLSQPSLSKTVHKPSNISNSLYNTNTDMGVIIIRMMIKYNCSFAIITDYPAIYS